MWKQNITRLSPVDLYGYGPCSFKSGSCNNQSAWRHISSHFRIPSGTVLKSLCPSFQPSVSLYVHNSSWTGTRIFIDLGDITKVVEQLQFLFRSVRFYWLLHEVRALWAISVTFREDLSHRESTNYPVKLSLFTPWRYYEGWRYNSTHCLPRH
jgi:hypothetical protein